MANSTGQTRNEDPNLSADGKYLFFKQDGDVMQVTLSLANNVSVFTSVVDIINIAPTIENSTSFPTTGVAYFATGTGSSMRIFRINHQTKIKFDAPFGLPTYYPIVRSDISTQKFERIIC